jgi:glycerol-3-phosphate dehydrogenase
MRRACWNRASRAEVEGALTLDEWGCDVFRLAALNALDARDAGAQLLARTEAESFVFSGSSVRGVRVRERDVARSARSRRDGRERGGAVGRIVAERAGARVQMRLGKGIHVTFERRIGNYGLILEGVDGRTMFLVPHGAETIVGTTDHDYYGDPAHVEREITRDDVAYVIESAARALPQATRWRPLRAWAGVRNTLFEWGVVSESLSRRHEIIDHAARDGVDGLVSVVGGKLAAYRIQAEETVDLLMRRLGRSPARVRDRRPTAAGRRAGTGLRRAVGAHRLPGATLERVWRRHGSRIAMIFDGAGPDELAPVCRAEGVTAAELRFVIERGGLPDAGGPAPPRARRRRRLRRQRLRGARRASARRAAGLAGGAHSRRDRHLSPTSLDAAPAGARRCERRTRRTPALDIRSRALSAPRRHGAPRAEGLDAEPRGRCGSQPRGRGRAL